MATTMTPNQPRKRPPQPRVSVRARVGDGTREAEYDLLTAALIGATIGAGLTYMMRRGPSGRRPLTPVMERVGQGATWAGRNAARLGKRGAHWAAERGEAMWDNVPRERIVEQVSDYVTRAHDAIDDAVASELKGLRRSMRRQRKRFGF
jgi:hypothetical protein